MGLVIDIFFFFLKTYIRRIETRLCTLVLESKKRAREGGWRDVFERVNNLFVITEI